MAKITPRALEVFSLRPVKLLIAKGPIFSQGPAARPATKRVDPKQHRFDLWRKWMLPMNCEITERIITKRSVRRTRALDLTMIRQTFVVSYEDFFV